MTTQELFDAVREWGRARKISDPNTQTVKLLEEAGEIAHEISRGNYTSDALWDAIGDTMVVLIILADITDNDVLECLEMAYNEIKDRNGKVVRGGFVKDEPNGK